MSTISICCNYLPKYFSSYRTRIFTIFLEKMMLLESKIYYELPSLRIIAQLWSFSLKNLCDELWIVSDLDKMIHHIIFAWWFHVKWSKQNCTIFWQNFVSWKKLTSNSYFLNNSMTICIQCSQNFFAEKYESWAKKLRSKKPPKSYENYKQKSPK